MAKEALERAGAQLSCGNDNRIPYACLELRLAIECLAYERWSLYKDELPADSAKWQPRKLLAQLLELDPYAGQDRVLSYARESSPGVRSENFKTLGAERVISNAKIKNSYDKLGAFLHTPTAHQLESGKAHDPIKSRHLCAEVIAMVNSILSSSIHNVRIRKPTSTKCLKCNTLITRRQPTSESDSFEGSCPACGTRFLIKKQPSGEINWSFFAMKVQCATHGCKAMADVLDADYKIGFRWECRDCGNQNALALGVTLDTQPDEG